MSKWRHNRLHVHTVPLWLVFVGLFFVGVGALAVPSLHAGINVALTKPLLQVHAGRSGLAAVSLTQEQPPAPSGIEGFDTLGSRSRHEFLMYSVTSSQSAAAQAADSQAFVGAHRHYR